MGTAAETVTQEPMQGASMAYSFDDAKAPERHETQYFEMFGNRGIYRLGILLIFGWVAGWVLARATAGLIKRG